MEDKKTTIEELKLLAKKFVDDRDWRQFHSPKNLSMCIATEAAELMEHFLWLNDKESEEIIKGEKQEKIEHEIADIAFATFLLCAHYNIDLSSIVDRKIKIIGQRYPIDQAKSRKDKYTTYMINKENKKD